MTEYKLADGSRLMIIDDPIKPSPPATAEMKAKQLEWYRKVSESGNGIIATTGWHDDDFMERLARMNSEPQV